MSFSWRSYTTSGAVLQRAAMPAFPCREACDIRPRCIADDPRPLALHLPTSTGGQGAREGKRTRLHRAGARGEAGSSHLQHVPLPMSFIFPTRKCSSSMLIALPGRPIRTLRLLPLNPSSQDNLFEWHFVMRGSSETAFEVDCSGLALCFSLSMQRHAVPSSPTPTHTQVPLLSPSLLRP